MQKLGLVISLCIVLNISLAQNLIPNPSFEDVNICKTYHEKCSPSGWRAVELKCFLYYEHLHAKEEQNRPKDGQRHIALRMYNRKRSEDRSFAQAPLLCPLSAGKFYRLSFYIHAQAFMLKSIGVWFADSISIHKKNTVLFEENEALQIRFENNIPSKKWIKATLDYKATGLEKAIVIGNFLPDSLTQLIKIVATKKHLPNRIYYSFDKFSLTPLDDTLSHCDLSLNKELIYKDSIRHIRNHNVTLPQNKPPIQENNITYDSIKTIIEPKEAPSEPIITSQKPFILKNLQFEFNSSIITSLSYPALDSLSQHLIDNPNQQIQITGHTDNIGSIQFNLRLSQNRANAVRTYLIQSGIEAERISASGLGDQFPTANNSTDEGRRTNRRVEFLIE